MDMRALRRVVDEQAEDAGLWFVAETAPEAYLQQALRRLHRLIETAESTATNAPPVGTPDALAAGFEEPAHAKRR